MRRKKKKEKISFLISRKKNVWLKSDLKHSLFKGSYKDDLLTLLRELDVKKKRKKKSDIPLPIPSETRAEHFRLRQHKMASHFFITPGKDLIQSGSELIC